MCVFDSIDVIMVRCGNSMGLVLILCTCFTITSAATKCVNDEGTESYFGNFT